MTGTQSLTRAIMHDQSRPERDLDPACQTLPTRRPLSDSITSPTLIIMVIHSRLEARQAAVVSMITRPSPHPHSPGACRHTRTVSRSHLHYHPRRILRPDAPARSPTSVPIKASRRHSHRRTSESRPSRPNRSTRQAGKVCVRCTRGPRRAADGTRPPTRPTRATKIEADDHGLLRTAMQVTMKAGTRLDPVMVVETSLHTAATMQRQGIRAHHADGQGMSPRLTRTTNTTMIDIMHTTATRTLAFLLPCHIARHLPLFPAHCRSRDIINHTSCPTLAPCRSRAKGAAERTRCNRCNTPGEWSRRQHHWRVSEEVERDRIRHRRSLAWQTQMRTTTARVSPAVQ